MGTINIRSNRYSIHATDASLVQEDDGHHFFLVVVAKKGYRAE